jgi:3-deoxy-7-phosphoheptulonate synthase
MNLKPVFNNPTNKRPIVIAGPCSAETEEQVLETAHQIAALGVADYFRAGIWKPRTRPNNFEGIGTEGLPWLKRVKDETGMKTATEVANAHHAYEALKHGVDILWIGARSTVNPFTVQEIADALKGVDIPVLVKNPVNTDMELWLGAVERLYQAGITRLGVIHRGFSHYGSSPFRNVPQWQIAIEMMRRFPNMTIVCDPSHICGNTTGLQDISQKALDLNYHGLMLETHRNPKEAWSDAKQQVTPQGLKELLGNLIIRNEDTENINANEKLDTMRRQIDQCDEELFTLLGNRMRIAEKIGIHKKANNISILQTDRWNEILEKAYIKAEKKELSREFVNILLSAIHQESINRQAIVMNKERVQSV